MSLVSEQISISDLLSNPKSISLRYAVTSNNLDLPIKIANVFEFTLLS